jgi:hypothetical protein
MAGMRLFGRSELGLELIAFGDIDGIVVEGGILEHDRNLPAIGVGGQ